MSENQDPSLFDVRPKVLIVDDVAANLKILRDALQPEGYEILVATSGKAALRTVAGTLPDLILLDVMMPEMNGYEVCQELKQNEATADIPIIFVTAKGDTESVVEGFSVGGVDYITKPFEHSEVRVRIRNHLTTKLLQDRLKQAKDELEISCNQLKQRTAELEVRNRFIRQTFGRYLTDEVVANLLESPEGLKVGGEKRKVTILMSDLRRFTPLVEALPPEKVVALLNTYLSTMTDVILKYDGTIDEFIGDGILVIFGAPMSKDDDAERAVACAVEMQLAMSEVNAWNRKNGLPEIEMGVGVNTGVVVVGNIGSIKRAKYGVVGSPVILTQRIESYTVGGQIMISETTYRENAALIQVNCQMEVEPKGVKKPITIYEVSGIGGKYKPQETETSDRQRENT